MSKFYPILGHFASIKLLKSKYFIPAILRIAFSSSFNLIEEEAVPLCPVIRVVAKQVFVIYSGNGEKKVKKSNVRKA